MAAATKQPKQAQPDETQAAAVEQPAETLAEANPPATPKATPTACPGRPCQYHIMENGKLVARAAVLMEISPIGDKWNLKVFRGRNGADYTARNIPQGNAPQDGTWTFLPD